MKASSLKPQASSRKLHKSSDQHPVSRIDSHQHFWRYDPVRDAWITDAMNVIQRDFLPDDLAPVLMKNHIDGCVAVQADQSGTETKFLLELADQHNFIQGVVGWIDLRGDDLESNLEQYAVHKKLKGFRHIAQAEPDGFLLQDDFSRGIESLKNYGYTYEILVYHHQLPDALNFVKAHPDQAFVIDHLAKPAIHSQEIVNWTAYMKAMAQYPQVMCKLSGMVTEAHWQQWKKEDFTPYLETVLECFGPDRLMYGSDWPVCLLAATYEQQLGIVEAFISTLSETEKQQIMGGNAIRFYHL
jgi:L-fuconolactonase